VTGDLPTRPLGSTGLTVTVLGLGLAALGRPAYIDLGRHEDLGVDRSTGRMERRAHAVLDAAYAAGVRYVDAARSYGRAEAFLASWLEARGLAPGSVTVGSKWGYRYVGDWRMDATVNEVKDHSLAAFEQQRSESFALLDGHLRLYQIHSATLESGVLDDRAVLGALAELGSQGTVVGLSVSGPRQPEVVRRALEVEVDGTNPFGCVQATWNVLEPSVGPALAEAAGAGWGVLVKEAVANGRLTAHGPGPVRAPLDRVAQRRGASADQVALAAVLDQPFVSAVLSGAVTPAQLESNLGARELDLDDEDRAELGALAEDPEAYWGTRTALPWA